jgi:hypothetical protein
VYSAPKSKPKVQSNISVDYPRPVLAKEADMRIHEIRRKMVAALGTLTIIAGTVAATTIATETAASAATGTVSGIVYRDWNYSGSTTERFASAFSTPASFIEDRMWPNAWWDTQTKSGISSGGDGTSWDRPYTRYVNDQEPGEAGIVITVTDSTGTSVGTATSTADGSFSVSVTAASNAVRVEMSIPTTKPYLVAGPKGARNGGNVQFATLGTDSTNMYFSVANPAEYCKHDSSAVLRLITPCWKFGDQKWSTPRSVLESLPFDSPTSAYASPPAMISEATENQIGTTYGLAWDPYRQNLFAGAYLRRHAGFGPSGTGAIYKIASPGTGAKTVTVFADINALFGAATAGADPHPASATPGCSGDRIFNPAVHAGAITTCENEWGHDVNSFDLVGKTSLGDIDISEDGTYLYVVNMQDKKIYRMSATTAPTSSADVTRVDIPVAASGTSGAYKCASADSRPMAITLHDGVGYVGVTCSMESGSGVSDPQAYVYAFNPITMSFTAAPVFNVKWGNGPWGWYRDAVDFTAWTSAWTWTSSGAFGDGPHEHSAQPIISSIAFDDRDMLVGIRNRYHDQVGQYTFQLNLGDTGTRTSPSSYDGGTIVRSCPSGGTWNPEGSSAFAESSCTGGTLPWNTSLYNQAKTAYPGGYKSLFSATTQGTEGAMVMLQGSQSRRADLYASASGTIINDLRGGKLIHTIGDANGSSWGAGIGSISPQYGWDLSGGATNATTGYSGSDASNFAITQGVGYSDSVLPGTTFGKSNGLGDLEVLCLYAPIDIGDRVWNDSNSDGIQQAGEPGLGNVTVELRQAGAALATATTDTNGNYLFSSRTGATTASERLGITNLKPGQTGLTVKVATSGGGITAGLHLATRGAGGSGKFDSDGLPDGSTSSFVITNSYSQSFDFDFGFCTSAGCTAGVAYAIGDVVFTDTNGNGTKDSGEIGQSGINVELLNATTSAVISGPVTTGASGAYKFDNLAAGTYKIRFSTLPSGSTWTTQTVGSDPLVDSNPDATTGVTATITLGTSGNPNIRAAVAGDGVTATQIDPSIDAGVRPPAAAVGSTVCIVPT